MTEFMLAFLLFTSPLYADKLHVYESSTKCFLVYNETTGKHNYYLLDSFDLLEGRSAKYIYENFEPLPYEIVNDFIIEMSEYCYGF